MHFLSVACTSLENLSVLFLSNLYAFSPNFSRYKRVIELGSGYGLAGLVIAAITEASEVVISDGNPQVVDCILYLFTF